MYRHKIRARIRMLLLLLIMALCIKCIMLLENLVVLSLSRGSLSQLWTKKLWTNENRVVKLRTGKPAAKSFAVSWCFICGIFSCWKQVSNDLKVKRGRERRRERETERETDSTLWNFNVIFTFSRRPPLTPLQTSQEQLSWPLTLPNRCNQSPGSCCLTARQRRR